MSIPEFADKIVNHIGIGERLVQPPKPRHLRWLPGVAVMMAIMAIAMQIFSESAQIHALAWALMVSAWTLADMVTRFGPLRQVGFEDQHDERERLTAMRARLFGLYSVHAVVVTGLIGFAVSAALQWRLPSALADWLMILGFLLTIRASLTTLHASWTTSPVDDDEELA